MLDVRDKARLFWHCRRGMLELDLILQKFLEQGVDKLNKEQLHAFDALLTHIDPQLYAWLMGHEYPEDKELSEIVALIRSYN